ncbi:MAG: M28 family peptidase [Acidobacteriia bacterium]|nr:M28 family peptidase [Terriglobia bacterium]
MAAILETVRVVRAGPPLKNDLIVLIADGEEAGLLGSEAFANLHPWIADLGLIMNFDNRGNHGPSLLFETSPGNASLVRSVAHSGARPIGSSLAYGLFKLLPNDTDFTSFRPFAIPGLNFAFGEGLDAYHTRLDTADNLSAASLQHHGSYALTLTHHFGQMDLAKLPRNDNDAIFFNWFGGSLVFYSQRWVLPVEALATLLLLAGIALALRRKDVQFSRVLLALLPVTGLLLLAAGAMALLWTAISWLLAGRHLDTDTPANALLLTGLALCGVLAGALFFHWIRRIFAAYELFAATLGFLCCCSWVVAVKFPAGSYLLFWPVFFGSIGLFVSGLRKAPSPAALIVASLPGTASALLLFAPVVYLVYLFFTLNVISVAVAGLFVGLALVLSLPYMNLLVPRSRPGLVLGILLTVAIAVLVRGATLSGHSSEHPAHDTVFYSLNADDSTAAWISYDPSLDRWSSQFFPAGARERRAAPQYVGGATFPVFSAPAPVQEIAAPVATIKSDEKDGDLHRLHLSVKSPRSAAAIYLRFPKEIRAVSAEIEGRSKPIGESPNPLRINLFGMADKEVDLKITLKAPAGLSFWLMDQSVGMPASGSTRPGDLMPWYGSDVTMVVRQYKL